MFSCPLFSKQSFDVPFDLVKRCKFVPFWLFFINLKYLNGLYSREFGPNLLPLYIEILCVFVGLCHSMQAGVENVQPLHATHILTDYCCFLL